MSSPSRPDESAAEVVPGDAAPNTNRSTDPDSEPDPDPNVTRQQPARAEVRPDSRLLIGFVGGSFGLAAATHPWSLKSAVVGVGTAVITSGCYLGWLYGHDRYTRWVINRHTYRPADHEAAPPR